MAKIKVLVVEDERIIAMDLKNRLQDLGYDVPAIASSGEEAVKKAEEIRPDLILMDILLKGMSGIGAAEQIRISHNIPVIYLTAFSDENIMKLAKMTEPYGYILKPFNDRELHITIEMALYRHKMETRLNESEQWLAAILKSIGDAVIATDMNGCVTFMNPVAERLTGWSKKDAFGKEFREVFYIINRETRENIECHAAKAIQEGAVINLPKDTILIARSGIETEIETTVEIPVSDSAAPIRNNKGNIVGAVIVFRAVTGSKK